MKYARLLLTGMVVSIAVIPVFTKVTAQEQKYILTGTTKPH